MERAYTPPPFFNGIKAESVVRLKIVLLMFCFLELN